MCPWRLRASDGVVSRWFIGRWLPGPRNTYSQGMTGRLGWWEGTLFSHINGSGKQRGTWQVPVTSIIEAPILNSFHDYGREGTWLVKDLGCWTREISWALLEISMLQEATRDLRVSGGPRGDFSFYFLKKILSWVGCISHTIHVYGICTYIYH